MRNASVTVVRGRAVSSTRIRSYIDDRKLSRAARLLTRPFFFDADIVRGEGVGRTLDFPTANARLSDPHKLVPPGGVYAVRVRLDNLTHAGMMNIGRAPTVRRDGGRTIEIHLFDFTGELYGRRMRINCLKFIREEKKFSDRAALRSQLEKDREAVRLIMEKKY